MIIMAFSNKTSKILPRVFCGELKHVAPIVVQQKKLTLYQFVRYGNVVKIPLLAHDIEILRRMDGDSFICHAPCPKPLIYAVLIPVFNWQN